MGMKHVVFETNKKVKLNAKVKNAEPEAQEAAKATKRKKK